ncbi:MAG TPA: hypothetical protein VJK49_06005 [Candidatus Limnocylindrales bacterium]|nr:hypothetical protein [Candidatus Limnocylindrales bacterium]
MRVSWSRRIGLAGALVVLVGGSIALASGALGPGTPGSGTQSSAAPLPAPTLLAPAATITSADTVDLTLIRPTGLATGEDYQVRIFVNGELERERPLPAQEQFQVTRIPLVEGDNVIRAALAGGGGQGQLSVSITIVRDDVPPVIRVFRPQPGSTIYTQTEVLRGRTESGASMSVTDVLSGQELETIVQPDGRFETRLALALGDTQLVLHSRDGAGNEASTRITMRRADSLAALTLTISAAELRMADLPQRLEARAIIQDERGQPVDGAAVTFSLSPPNAATMTYRTSSVAGRATWPEMDIANLDDPLGTWLVTVLAVLPSGAELRDDESLTVR